MSPPPFPRLLAPPGFAPIALPGALPGGVGIAAHDWSSFLRPVAPSPGCQSLSGWTQPVIMDTSIDSDKLPDAISPIIHVPSSDLHVSPASVSAAKIVPNGDRRLMALLLNHSSSRLVLQDSMSSDCSFYRAMDSPEE